MNLMHSSSSCSTSSLFCYTSRIGLAILFSLPLPIRSETLPAPVSGSQKPAFQEAVLPLFEKYCVSCHGPERTRGQLRLDSFEHLLKGGKSGPFPAGDNNTEPQLLSRILAPTEDNKRMPPPGKPQPSRDEIAIIQWWIQSGADAENSISQLNPPDNILTILSSKDRPAQEMAESAPPLARPEILPLAERLADTLGISISPLSQSEPWLQVNAGLAGSAFGDKELAQLAPLGPNLRWLNLGGTGITDQGLKQINPMRHLTRLHLERTGVTDSGLSLLTSLSQLEYLNLYGTKITDGGLAPLRSLRSLRRIYLWQTQVTPEAAKAFGDALEDKAQIRKWEEEIAQLKTKIIRHMVLVDTGVPLKSKGASVTPVNTRCPVSGKSVDPTKTTLYEGRLIAFCCDNCKAAFDKDPKAYLAKLDAKEAKLENKE